MIREAVISDCRLYRYSLTRIWGLTNTPRMLVVCMLNPSTADATLDDNTIRRCIGFAMRDGYDGIIVVNLYALRSPDPDALAVAEDPIGPMNDQHLQAVALHHTTVLCAWGANAEPVRARQVARRFLAAGAALRCLGTTHGGFPRHPLYIKRDHPMVPYGVSA